MTSWHSNRPQENLFQLNFRRGNQAIPTRKSSFNKSFAIILVGRDCYEHITVHQNQNQIILSTTIPIYVHNFLWKYTPHSSQIPQISSSFSQTYTIKTAHTHLASCPLNCTGPRESIRRPPRFFQGRDGKKLVRLQNWEPLPVKLDDWQQLDLFWEHTLRFMTCTNHQKSNRRINVPLSTSSSASWSFCSLSPVKTLEKLAKKNNVDMISYGLYGNRVCIYIYNPPWPANVWPGNMSDHHLSSPSKTSNVSLQKFPSERCDRRLLLSPPPSIHDGKIWQLCQGEVSENALPADFPGCFLEIFLTRHRFLSHILQFLWSKLERTHVAVWCPNWHDELKKGFCCFFASNFS